MKAVSYGVHSVIPPGFREGTNFGKILPIGGSTFFQGRGGILLEGNPNFWYFTRPPRGGNANSVPKFFLSIYQIISPLSHFDTLFCYSKSVCPSVFSNQYSALIRKTPSLRRYHQSRENPREVGESKFPTPRDGGKGKS